MSNRKVAVITGADALQQPIGRVRKPEDIAELFKVRYENSNLDKRIRLYITG